MVKVFRINELLWSGSAGRVTVLVDEKLSKRLMAGVVVIEPHQRIPPEGFSEHPESDELAYVVEGSAVFGREDGEFPIQESDLIFNPRGTKHYVRNDSNKPCRMIWALSPPINL
ncbi:MAG: cupin domain-containing protein [Candidatus Caldarchaeum sp.]|jgi:quercetin dioxygenase-like cupin family protein